jgi:hypothetical protein
MQPLLKRINELSTQVNTAYEHLKIDEKKQQAIALEKELSQPEAWNNPAAAHDKSKRLANFNQFGHITYL